MMRIFALDIGGAFIKVAFLPETGKPARAIIPFELWKQSAKLPGVLRSLKPKGKCRCVITMTGELCDCFKNRKEGVAHIINAATRACGDVRVLNVNGKLLQPSEAIQKHRQAASANWVAVPTYLALMATRVGVGTELFNGADTPFRVSPIGRNNRLKPVATNSCGDFLLVDIGSTTTDLTPVRGGKIANNGFTDFERMKNGELLYTGYLRTSVPAVTHGVTVRGAWAPLAAEYFCQTGDVHLALGSIGPKKYNAPTPDGGPKTAVAAKRRLARSVLADEGELTGKEIMDIAIQIARAQEEQIVTAARKFRLPVIAIGSGAFILQKAIARGVLHRHPLMENPEVRGMDPSLALAYLAL